jgi:hypothetical protein
MSNHRDTCCQKCRFWNAKHDFGSGECRRHAPVVFKEADPAYERNFVFPLTNYSDWCGDFQPEPEQRQPSPP